MKKNRDFFLVGCWVLGVGSPLDSIRNYNTLRASCFSWKTVRFGGCF
jgi:hypothetical protein